MLGPVVHPARNSCIGCCRKACWFHASPNRHSISRSACALPVTIGARCRESRSTSTGRGTEGEEVSSPHLYHGPNLLGYSSARVAEMGGRIDHRQTVNGRSLAPGRLQGVLALEIAQAWETHHRTRDPGADSPDGFRELDVGWPAYPCRTSETRILRLRVHRVALHAKAAG